MSARSLEYAVEVTWTDARGQEHVYLDEADDYRRAKEAANQIRGRALGHGQEIVSVRIVWRDVSAWEVVEG